VEVWRLSGDGGRGLEIHIGHHETLLVVAMVEVEKPLGVITAMWLAEGLDFWINTKRYRARAKP
jgi:hypothetical protein